MIEVYKNPYDNNYAIDSTPDIGIDGWLKPVTKQEAIELRDALLKEFPLENELKDLQEKVDQINKVTNEWDESK